MGNLLAVVVHATNIHDTKAGILAAGDAYRKYPSIQQFCAHAGYRKTFEQDISSEPGLGVDISVRIKPQWEVLPNDRHIPKLQSQGSRFVTFISPIHQQMNRMVLFCPDVQHCVQHFQIANVWESSL